MREDLATEWAAAADSFWTKFTMGFKTPDAEQIEPHLEEGERVLVMQRCEKRDNPSRGGHGCTVVLTDKRLYLFSRRTLQSTINREAIALHLITGVELFKWRLGGWSIEVTRAGNVDYLVGCAEPHAKRLTDELVARVDAHGSGTPTVIQQNLELDPLDQLKKLKDLLDLGILNQSEYEEKRSELLKRIQYFFVFLIQEEVEQEILRTGYDCILIEICDSFAGKNFIINVEVACCLA